MIRHQPTELEQKVQRFLDYREQACGTSAAELDSMRAFVDWDKEYEEQAPKEDQAAPGGVKRS
jgi:hypothetical protein